jgi:hypothetical protein
MPILLGLAMQPFDPVENVKHRLMNLKAMRKVLGN